MFLLSMLFNWGPEYTGSFILSILLTLIISFATNALFPAIIAVTRKKIIFKETYTRLCFLVNFLLWLVLVLTGYSLYGGLGYLIFTALSVWLGRKVLRYKGLLR